MSPHSRSVSPSASPVSPKSTSSGESESSIDVKDLVLEEPMYYVLAQFFESQDGKNITTVLQELILEMRALKNLLMMNLNHTAPAPPSQPVQPNAET